MTPEFPMQFRVFTGMSLWLGIPAQASH